MDGFVKKLEAFRMGYRKEVRESAWSLLDQDMPVLTE